MRLVLLTLLAVIACQADVVDAAANGFTVKTTWIVNASQADVYRKLVQNVGDWWNPAHTFSKDSHNLSIDVRPMGCFCEKLPNGGGVRHLEVLTVMPEKAIVMSGGLGPLQSLGLNGVLSIELAPTKAGTKLDMTYVVSGYVAGGLETWAPRVDGMLKEQFTRLKDFVEHGSPEAAK